MSFYDQGLAVGTETETPKIRIGGEEQSSKGMIASLVAIGAIGFGLWWFLREKPAKQEGPDTGDIEERIRARGLDPHQFGYGKG